VRSDIIFFCALALGGIPAVAQNRARATGPVGLVMSSGATLVRGAQSIAAKPGEILFNGDSLRTTDLPLTFLFCPRKQSATLAPGSEIVLAQDSYQVKSGGVQEQRQISACFLPPAQKLSVASMQHYGVMLARSGGVPPPDTTLVQRINALPAPVREQLSAELDACDVAIARDANDLGAMIGSAAAFERAGLLFDAGQAYRKILLDFPGLPWIAARIVEIERDLEREQLKKE
jgi:hypothetical protein